MSTWMNEAAVPNHNGNAFPHMNDGAMMDPSAFMTNPAAQFNPGAAGQFPNQQPMMPNGPMRNASPGFQGPVYQTNSVIPSKRPRPREDSIGAAGSPRQNPGMLPTSRSETPQHFAGFQPGAMAQPNPGQPSPYPHLQPNGSANATPSPIMANQMRPGSVPQRVATASPHPFSPSAPQFGSQGSPIPSDHGTPQPNPYMQNMAPGFNPNFTPTPPPARPAPGPNAMGSAPMMPQQMNQMAQQMGQMPNQMFPPQMQQARNPMEQQKMAAYQMRLQQQLQGNMGNMSNMQMAAQMQAQSMAQGRGVMPNQPMPMANGQMPPNAMRPQPRPVPQTNPEQFMKNLAAFMSQRGIPLEMNPTVGDRPVPLVHLFSAVYSKAGYQNVTSANGWPHIAVSLGFPPNNATQAGPILKVIYERNLLKFEEAWQMQNRNKMMAHNMPKQNMPGGQGPSTPAKQMPPQKMMSQGQPPQQMPTGGVQTPVKPMPQGPQQPAVNGFSTPGPQGQPPPPNSVPGHARNSLSQPSPSHGPDFPMPSPAPSKAGSMTLPPGHPDGGPLTGTSIDPRASQFPERPDEYTPVVREPLTYGGVDLHSALRMGVELERWKPDLPTFAELGVIDIHALTRSLQSGIHGEVRLSLDTLASVTAAPHNQLYVYLSHCEDLVDALLDCGEEAVDLLVENTIEVSDDMQIVPYEDVARACRIEKWAVADTPAFGTHDYQLDRAVDRLICITTILRNLSFPDQNGQIENQLQLADESVVRFICVVIRYLGTRNMFLRTHSNTLDFMKDTVTLLSNISGSVEIPGREQAFCLLQFLLAFSPCPGPTLSNDRIYFPAYEPLLHPYLPNAIDAIAKLLARDEPNRTHYKTLFMLDAGTPLPYDMLTRTFALAICPVPDHTKDRPHNMPSLVEARKPLLMQGLLAAEVLASLAPGYESDVARTWLLSGNGWEQNLYRLAWSLSSMVEQLAARAPPPPTRGSSRHQQQQHNAKDMELVYIACLSVALLRKLTEKSRDPNNPALTVPANVLPSRESVLGALQMPSVEWAKEGLLVDLIAYSSLGD